MSTKCSKCQSTKVSAAVLDNANLTPAGGGMLARAVHIELRANACLDCGHVELSADPANLKALAIVG